MVRYLSHSARSSLPSVLRSMNCHAALARASRASSRAMNPSVFVSSAARSSSKDGTGRMLPASLSGQA